MVIFSLTSCCSPNILCLAEAKLKFLVKVKVFLVYCLICEVQMELSSSGSTKFSFRKYYQGESFLQVFKMWA